MSPQLPKCLLVSAAFAVWSGRLLAAQYSYTTFDYPGQPATVWKAVNNSGAVAGFTGNTGSLNQIGLLANLNKQVGGTFSVTSVFTYPMGIDATGQVIGRSSSLSGNIFLRSPSGVVTVLELPSGVTSASQAVISGNGRIARTARWCCPGPEARATLRT